MLSSYSKNLLSKPCTPHNYFRYSWAWPPPLDTENIHKMCMSHAAFRKCFLSSWLSVGVLTVFTLKILTLWPLKKVIELRLQLASYSTTVLPHSTFSAHLKVVKNNILFGLFVNIKFSQFFNWLYRKYAKLLFFEKNIPIFKTFLPFDGGDDE